MWQFVKKNQSNFLLALMIVIYVGYFSYFTIQRHQKLQSSYYDLGIMDQTVYNTYRGRFLELSDPISGQTIKRMAIHNDVLLAFLAPLYVFHEGPETLLVIQTIILALGAIPLYLLAKKILNSEFLALTLSFCYLMYPPLQRSNIFDFHAVTLATSLLLFMYYFWTEKKKVICFIFLLLAMLSKEQVALTTGLFGLFVMYQSAMGPAFFKKKSNPDRKELTFGLLILLVSIAWFVLSFWVIIPHFRQADHFALSRYKEFGESTSGIISGFFLKPLTTLSKIISISTLRYIFLITSPLLFLSFLSPMHFLIALPDLAINVISSEANMHDIVHHYTAVITPFLFISAIYGLATIKKKYQKISNTTIFLLIIGATLILSYTKGPLPYSREKNTGPFGAKPELTRDISVWKQMLYNDTIKVAATDTLAAQFSDRRVIMRFTSSYVQADYVILNRNEIFNSWLDWYNMPTTYTELKNNKNFTLEYKHDGFEVYKRI